MKSIVPFLAASLVALLIPSNGFPQGNLRGGSVNGTSYGSDDEALVERLRLVGASTVRLYFDNEYAATQTETEYRTWVDTDVLPRMDTLVDLFANQKGMKVLISLPRAPGGRVSSPAVMDPVLDPNPANEWMRTLLVETWGKIALRYNALGSKVGYQIFSEPAPPADTSAWLALQKRLIDAIRDADATPIDQQPTIFYMTLFGTPSKTKAINIAARRGSMGLLANMYHPFKYTHQLTPSAANSKMIKYPNCQIVGSKKKPTGASALSCSRDGIEGSLKTFVKFAKKNKLSMAISEVAVSRRAPSAPRYLGDVFKTLKKLNIGWYYFTLTERGDSPWRIDCTDASGEVCTPAALNSPSSRQQVLEKYFLQLK